MSHLVDLGCFSMGKHPYFVMKSNTIHGCARRTGDGKWTTNVRAAEKDTKNAKKQGTAEAVPCGKCVR